MEGQKAFTASDAISLPPKTTMAAAPASAASTTKESTNTAAATTTTTWKKTVLVVKKKKGRAKIQNSLIRSTSSKRVVAARGGQQRLVVRQTGGGLPSARQLANNKKSIPKNSLVIVHQQQQQQRQPQAIHEDDLEEEEEDDDDALLWADMACDTQLVFESLQGTLATSVAIPLQSMYFQRQQQQQIQAVLECQLYSHLNNETLTVSRELAHLLRTSVLCKLSAPPTNNNTQQQQQQGLQVLLKTEDYKLAVQDALALWKETRRTTTTTHAATAELEQTNLKEHQADLAVEWLLRHLPHLTRERLVLADFQRARQLEKEKRKRENNNNNKEKALRDGSTTGATSSSSSTSHGQGGPLSSSLPLATLLQVLVVDLQILLASHHLAASNNATTVYQLWLPSWGTTVLKAWDKAQSTLINQIKRSQYKERSLQALRQPYSPIPTDLLVEWLQSTGVIHVQERPSGKFVQLVN